MSAKQTIAALARAHETNIRRMSLFCLDPQASTLSDILADNKLKMKMGVLFDIWVSAVGVKYGNKWGIASDATYEKTRTKILKKLQNTPKASTIDAVAQLFFATGDSTLLLRIFKVGGNMQASENIRKVAIDRYIGIVDEYTATIEKIKAMPKYIIDHEFGEDILAVIGRFEELVAFINSQR